MARNKRGRSYKMTPRRKAALAKAQAASARKRRRRGAVVAGVVAATLVAGGALAYGGNRKVQSNRRTARTNAYVASLPKPQLALPAGKGTRTTIHKVPRHPDGPAKSIKTTPQTVFKVSAKGSITRTTKKRMIYDLNRRRGYWQSQPIGGATRKPYTSTKRGLR